MLTHLPYLPSHAWRTSKIEMNESEFITHIDCHFPYQDRQEASRLIDLACQLSPDAAFMVAHELARPPQSKLRRYRGKLTP